ncbi:hypothetical protein BDN72DRAFT_303984 [Pluteus cervinus]|uniref:Uncharacterized protein n=1 Tax=Pluteus cervinus TaxID=181527 RepID=A0ACD3B3P7_9AGAR|nr:hypothetical protein BDN72DRAFT_303984 [Pluteus cervinus]
MPQNLVYDIAYFAFGKLHLNSYLACLNAREAIQERFHMQDPILLESQLTPGLFRDPPVQSVVGPSDRRASQ